MARYLKMSIAQKPRPYLATIQSGRTYVFSSLAAIWPKPVERSRSIEAERTMSCRTPRAFNSSSENSIIWGCLYLRLTIFEGRVMNKS